MSIRTMEIELTVGKDGYVHVDVPCELPEGEKVTVRVAWAVANDELDDELIWLRTAMTSPSFAFLDAPEEDIYTRTDGKPFDDGG